MKILPSKTMSKLFVELVMSPADLEPGDIVIYGSSNGLRTAKIQKKPAIDTRYGMQYYKSTRCLVCNEIMKVNSTKWDPKTRIYNPVVLEYNIQKFDLENFNKTKYITFRENTPMFRIVNQ